MKKTMKNNGFTQNIFKILKTRFDTSFTDNIIRTRKIVEYL